MGKPCRTVCARGTFSMRYCLAAKFIGFVATCLALAGCVSPHAYYGDDGCGGPCAVSGRHVDCGMAGCNDCGPDAVACGSCGDVGPHPGVMPRGPLRRMLTCNAGCGDLYFGEWHYDPPDSCDPCNDHGDFVGPVGCGPSCWQRFWAGVHGVRCCPPGCEPACGISCGAAGCVEPYGGYAGDAVLPPDAFETDASLWAERQAFPGLEDAPPLATRK